MDFQYLFKGIAVGLMVSIPLGPIGVLIIQKTIQKGRLAGFISGLGAAVADMFYATVAAFGLGMVLSFIESQEFYLQLVGSVFLIYVGMRIFLTNPIKQIRGARKPGKKGMLGDFVSIFFLTASNPIAVFVFVAVFAGTSIFGTDPTLRIELFLILGVLLGGALWWYVLSTIINIFRKKFRLKQLFWINKISGIVIAVLGLLAFLACFEPIKSFIHS
ncbi:LysE family translocator [Labilibaculum sp.]|uniref:LysE family translocator n=1 Tax=Labilibaculum sp. TaxID=2060723 RepID=UPI0035696DF6